MGKRTLYRGFLMLGCALLACGLWTLGHPSTLFAQGAAPYPPSPVITGWSWAPVEEITRAPQNGNPFAQTFAVTWGDDDGIYTVYGDGYGFAPQAVAELSRGIARIEGQAGAFEGANLSSTGEEVAGSGGDHKASSLLMVDHMLYMWVRNTVDTGQNNGEDNSENNAGGCQLAWSPDGGRTWTWGTWAFSEFGDCVFVNFGANYAGARDEYIYIVTPDSPTSDVPADHFVLMRVPQKQIGTRAAYEYLASIAPDNTPTWTADINGRGSVFTHPGRALRSSITYNAALGRYLWWQQHPSTSTDSGNVAGMGIYDAPQPWGPWTTAFYTEAWDVDSGESGTFPSKWVSADGTTVHLAFASDALFAVRRATLTVNASDVPTIVVTNTVVTNTVVPDTPTTVAVAPDTVLEGTNISDTPQSDTPAPDGSTPEWATITGPESEQTVPVAPENTNAFESPLPTPASSDVSANIAALQSPLEVPLDTLGAAAGVPGIESSQITDTRPVTITLPATTSLPATNSLPLREAAPIAERFPLSNAANVTDTQALANREAGSALPIEAPEPTPTVPTPLPTVIPGPLVVAQTPYPVNPLASIFGLETLIMMLLCLVSVSVSVLGFSALVVTVLYVRAQFYTEKARKESQLRLYRTRELPALRTGGRYTR